MIHSRSLLRRVVAGVAGLVLAASALFMPGGSLAYADDSTAIQVVSAKLTHVTETGTEITEARQLYIGDYFYLDIEFDASKANPKAGDSLTVEMPRYVVNRDAGNSRTEVLKPLEYHDSSGQTIKAGECKIESN